MIKYRERTLLTQTDSPIEAAAMKACVDFEILSEDGETETIRKLANERCVGAVKVLDAVRKALREDQCS